MQKEVDKVAAHCIFFSPMTRRTGILVFTRQHLKTCFRLSASDLNILLVPTPKAHYLLSWPVHVWCSGSDVFPVERTVKVYLAVTSFSSVFHSPAEQIFMKTTCWTNKMSSVGKEGSLKLWTQTRTCFIVKYRRQLDSILQEVTGLVGFVVLLSSVNAQ